MDASNPGRKTGYRKNNTNSVDFCIEICSTNNYTYAGMQVSVNRVKNTLLERTFKTTFGYTYKHTYGNLLSLLEPFAIESVSVLYAELYASLNLRSVVKKQHFLIRSRYSTHWVVQRPILIEDIIKSKLLWRNYTNSRGINWYSCANAFSSKRYVSCRERFGTLKEPSLQQILQR